MFQSNSDKIKEVVREFFGKTGFLVQSVEIKTPEDSTIPISLKMEEPQILIGESGQTLTEVQRLLKMIIQKRFAPESHFYVDLDINDYKKKKKEYLKEMARNAADEVSLTKREKMLPAMSAYERRVIHVELASRGDVLTESIGQEPARLVSIKPRPQL